MEVQYFVPFSTIDEVLGIDDGVPSVGVADDLDGVSDTRDCDN